LRVFRLALLTLVLIFLFRLTLNRYAALKVLTAERVQNLSSLSGFGNGVKFEGSKSSLERRSALIIPIAPSSSIQEFEDWKRALNAAAAEVTAVFVCTDAVCPRFTFTATDNLVVLDHVPYSTALAVVASETRGEVVITNSRLRIVATLKRPVSSTDIKSAVQVARGFYG